MCGIVGAVWNLPEQALSHDAISRMLGQVAHRGPDGQGAYRFDGRFDGNSHVAPRRLPGVALAAARLAIVDPVGSGQPVASEDGRVQVVFNGEIYNHGDLRRRLEGAGHTFRTQGDAETLVHLYEDEGPDLLRHLVGMFALAIWDERRGRLMLARDRLGQMPLVYRKEAERFLFASELKAIVAAPGDPRDVDPTSLDEYFTYGYVPHPHTIFRGINKLPPAHYALLEDGRLTIHEYWRPDFGVESRDSLDDQTEKLKAHLTESIRGQMAGDGPRGVFLSGGVDSSLVAALLRRESDQAIETFSIGFPVSEYDEAPYARRVAEHLSCKHHETYMGPDAGQAIQKLAWHFDDPLADSSALPTYFLSRLASQHVKVALTGDGADELFAGYGRYHAAQLATRLDRVPAPVRRLLAAPLAKGSLGIARHKGFLERGRRFAVELGSSPRRRFSGWTTIFSEGQRAALYTDSFVESLPGADPYLWLERAFDRVASRDICTQATLVDLQTYLPCDLLTKVDIASMAHGLECRSVFLDHRVVELAVSLPWSAKHRGRRGKWILRKAWGDLLPKEVFARRKTGFSAPLDAWFRNEWRPLVESVFDDAQSLLWRYVLPQVARRIMAEHTEGRIDHAGRIWSLLFLEHWLREWTGR